MGDSGGNHLRLAATTVMIRDSATGIEALMLERPARGSFPEAWVFPGGRIDPGDWGDGDLIDEAEPLAARRAAVRETFEETGLTISADALTPLAMWSPPIETTPRYRTWFYIARAPEGEIIPSPDEVVRHRWVRPADLLTAHAKGHAVLVVPTWVTLHQLSEAETVDAAIDHAVRGPFEHYETHILDGGKLYCWFGDDAVAEPPATASRRHRLEAGSLPWRYVRDPA